MTDEVTYVETVIENTTSSAFSLRESQRFPLYEDAVVVIRTERELNVNLFVPPLLLRDFNFQLHRTVSHDPRRPSPMPDCEAV